jgi:hypothetical protein
MSNKIASSAKPDDAVRDAIKAGDFAAKGVHFKPFRLKTVPFAANFEDVWIAMPKLFSGEKYPNVIFYRYRGSNGPFLPFGDVIVPGGGRSEIAPPVGLPLFAPGEDEPDCLAHPIGFQWILNNGGAPNPRDVSYWRLVPPPGYTALGITFGLEHPRLENYWCVKNEYVEPAKRCDAWYHDHWERNANLARPVFGDTPAIDGVISLAPPTFVGVDDKPWMLKMRSASLPVETFRPPDPAYDPDVASGDQTSPGLKTVEILPYTAISGDAWFQDQPLTSPFYFVACEPLWKCDATHSTPVGGSQTVTQTVGVSKMSSVTFEEHTSFQVSCSVGLSLASNVSATYTRSFALTTQTSTTDSTEKQTSITVMFPESDLVAVWSRQARIAVFRLNGSLVSEVYYSMNDQRLVSETKTLEVRAEAALAD